MFDLRVGPPRTISHEFALASDRAMQCPALDHVTGEFYVSQAQGTLKPESIQITRNSVGPVRTRLSVMRLVKAGHGTTIAILRRKGVLGIVVNAWGTLSWIPYKAGDVTKSDPSVVPIWKGTYAYIDHEEKTVCLRLGDVFTLYELVDDTIGHMIGKPVNGVTSSGPGQGYCTIKSETSGEFFLFSMWDYGNSRSKPMVAVGSFTTGALLYRQTARVLPASYTRQEPESGFGLGGVFHLGMSVKVNGQTKGVAVRFPPLTATPPVQPPEHPVVNPTLPALVKPQVRLGGNDVASYQPLWSPNPTQGLGFIKATQGTMYFNPFRARQSQKVLSLRLIRGFYHYLEKGKPVEQARHFVKTAKVQPGDLLWCDWEGDWKKGKHPSVEDAAAFIAEVQRLCPENRVGLYCNRSDWANTAVKSGDALWIAEYGVTKPSINAAWDFWQYSDKPIDQNWSRFTNMVDLRAWANSKQRAA